MDIVPILVNDRIETQQQAQYAVRRLDVPLQWRRPVMLKQRLLRRAIGPGNWNEGKGECCGAERGDA